MMEFWHGGKRWEGSPELRPAKQGKYECGPGIYLTTSYDRARKYAKFGKVTTKVTLSEDIGWLEKTKLPLSEVLDYARTAPRLPRRAKLLADLARCPGESRALAETDLFDVNRLVNVLVNAKALTGQRGIHLANWLASKGIDASLQSPTTGEQWVIVFNPAIIRKHRVVSATVVTLAERELPLIQLPLIPSKGQITMAAKNDTTSREIEFTCHPGMKLKVYGVIRATNRKESQEQGFFVSLDDVATPRDQLSLEQRAAVQQYLANAFPEHAQL